MVTPKFKKFKIEAYKPGRSKVRKLKKVIKLSANESALGISPMAKKLISNKKMILDKYHDGKSEDLKKAINKGLETIITNSYFKNIKITQIVVKDLDKEILKLLNLRQSFNPKKSIAITGTNGKTSVAWYLAQICKYNRIRFASYR